MSEESRRMIEATVANLKDLNEESLRIMQSSSEVLKARDAMDRQLTVEEPEQKGA